MEQPAGKKRILNEEEYKRVLKEDDDIEKRKYQPEIYEIFNKIKKQWVKTKQKEKARRKKLLGGVKGGDLCTTMMTI